MERIDIVKKSLIWLVIPLLLLVAGFATAQDNSSPQIPPLAPKWQTPPPGQLLSTGAPVGADGAVMAKAPDDSAMMVVYNYRVSGLSDRDPYFRVYDGTSWSPVRSVLITPDTNSGQLALAYGADNVAHLFWEEPDVGLFYMRYENGSWGGLNVIETGSRVFGVSVSVWGSQTIDVAWAARASQFENPNIYHARSTNGGNTWSTPVTVANSAPTSQLPKIAHASSGNVHLVWQESTAAPGAAIHYARGLPWSQPTVVTPTSIQNARRPSLTVAGNTLYLAYAVSQELDVNSADQWAYFSSCSGNCTSPSYWTNPVNVSGQPVRVNESAPFDLIPEIESYNGCRYIFFHGYVPSASPNEVVWNVNSCDGWSAGGRDQVTGFDMRGIYPQIALIDGAVHLVYQWVDGGEHQIYYMQGTLVGAPGPGAGADGVFLPMFSRS